MQVKGYLSEKMKKFFIDELISSPKINGGNEETRKSLKDCLIFLVQNILPTVPNKVDYSQLPRLAPPYENCWFEWTKSVKRRDDVPEDFSGEFDDQMLDIMMNMEGDARIGIKLSSNRIDSEGWNLYFQFFLRIGNNLPLMFPLAYMAELDSEGFFVSMRKYIEEGINPIFNALTNEVLQDDMLQKPVDTVFYALGLLNCKNIVIMERGGQPVGIKRNRNRKWVHRHYILQIRPMREIAKIEYEDKKPEEENESQDLSFHFCRGHFKVYTTEKPLFGKYVGTFWWDAHARGSIKKGIVTKDYDINSPDN